MKNLCLLPKHIFILMFITFISGCVSEVVAPVKSTLPPGEAKSKLRDFILKNYKWHDWNETDKISVTFEDEALHVVGLKNSQKYIEYIYKYDDPRSLVAHDYMNVDHYVEDSKGERWYFHERSDAESFVNYFASLAAAKQNHQPISDGEIQQSKSEVDDFKRVADAYHSNPKREFPEEAHRYRAVAEFAFKNKNYQKAADNYKSALEIAPWWPEGHYNRGLILGQLNQFSEAADEMKKYLMLVPNAENARAAKDKIYIWEDQVK